MKLYSVKMSYGQNKRIQPNKNKTRDEQVRASQVLLEINYSLKRVP